MLQEGTPKSRRRKPSVCLLVTTRIVSEANVLIDDVESAKTSMRGQNISGAEAKKQGEEWAQIAGSKIDHTVCSLSTGFLPPL